MDEPDWTEVIRVMYREEPPLLNVEGAGERELFTPEWLAHNTSLTKDQVDRTTGRMKQWGLVTKVGVSIEDEKETTAEVQFTEDGFTVAHEQEIAERDQDINQALVGVNRALVVFTVFLVLSRLVGPIPWSPEGKITATVLLLGGILVATVVLIYFQNI